MEKPAKIILGIVTLWPILYLVVFFAFILSQFFLITQEGTPSFEPFFLIFGLHFLTMLWIFALLIFYIINVFKNDRIAQDKKTLWAVELFMGNMIAMPIYWYLYIWCEPRKTYEYTSLNTT